MSARSGEDGASSGMTRTGRRFAKTPSTARQFQQSLFRPDGCVRVRPLRPAYGTEDNCVAFLAACDRIWRQRVATGVDGGAADELLAESEVVTMTVGDSGERGASGMCDFRPDTVTRQQGNQGVQLRSSSKRSTVSMCCLRYPS